MYDTINFWLSFDKAGNFDMSRILQSLSDITVHTKEDGQAYHSGNLRNYKVNMSGQGISLKGSLAKYFLPDNFHTLTRSDTARAIEQLSDELHLPIINANLSRIDFAQNFIMDCEPEAYYPYLGDSQYYKRLMQPKSIYYVNGLRQKVFYDKVAEGKKSRLKLPDVWTGQNVLRYELRLCKRLPNELNMAEVTAKHLYDERFYMTIFDKWQAEYESINKLNNLNFNTSTMKSPKDFWNQICLMAINTIGQEKIMQEIEFLKEKKTFDKPEYYCRLKNEVRELCKAPDLTASSDLMAELDKKIKDAKRFYR